MAGKATASCKDLQQLMPVLTLLEQLHLTILSISLNASTFMSNYSSRKNQKVGKDPAWLDWWCHIKVNPAESIFRPKNAIQSHLPLRLFKARMRFNIIMCIEQFFSYHDLLIMLGGTHINCNL